LTIKIKETNVKNQNPIREIHRKGIAKLRPTCHHLILHKGFSNIFTSPDFHNKVLISENMSYFSLMDKEPMVTKDP